MTTHDEMVAEWLQDYEFRREYEALAEEFAFFDELLRARQRAGLTQAEVAQRMGSKPATVASLETSGRFQKSSPTLTTLQKYAKAVGCRLEIKLKPV